MEESNLTQQPLLTIPQIVLLLFVIVGLVVALDFQRREKQGQLVGIGQERLESEVSYTATRQIELRATLHFVQSDDYIAAYARQEAGYILPGEKRIVPLVIEVTPTPLVSQIDPTPDPLYYALPWQAWWHMLTDYPQPIK